MAVMNLSTLSGILPEQIIGSIISKTKTGSVGAALSAPEPMKFGDVKFVNFDQSAVAEFVEESGAKSSQTLAPSIATAVPHKAVVTYRTSDEFIWADEDYQLDVLNQFSTKAAEALARALDLGAIYRINPKTGNEITSWTNYLNATTSRVELGEDPELSIEAAVGLVLASGYNPNGIALAPAFGHSLATARYSDGRKKFPDLGYGNNITSFEGLSAAVSSTVQGKPRDEDPVDNGVKAIIGNWSRGFRWGIQKDIPFEVIPFGDPDNTGRDLKGHNEVALRSEVVYAWHAKEDAFSVLETSVDAGDGEG